MKNAKESTMKTIKNFVAVTALLVSFGSFAESITATASTLDAAEAKVAAQAKDAGASYKITGARVDNRAYVSAELIK
jgi:hypothetical protein